MPMHQALNVSSPTLNRTEVDLKGLLEVLGKHLYSTPAVAIRELVQNAHDSCVRRQLESRETFESSIVLIADPVARTVVIEDTGAGLTDEEIRRWLATVGRGATRELRRSQAGDEAGLIGQFGVGFLTAYFVSTRVEVETTSMREPDRGWRFSSRGGESYTLVEIPARPVGTRVTLYLSDEAAALAEVVSEGRLAEDYFALLPTPVYTDATRTVRVNDLTPPWRQAVNNPVRLRKLELEFAERFEPVFKPLACISIPFDTTDQTQGLIWIQDGASYLTSDHRHVSVFVRGMLVTHDARDLLPAWAGFMGAVLESHALTPTASREDLQEDAVYKHLLGRIRSVVVDGLEQLSRRSQEAWRTILHRHDEALRGAAIAEERLFRCLGDALKVPTTEGDMVLETAANRSSERKIFVSLADAGGPEAVLHRALGQPVIHGRRYAVLPFAERWCEDHQATLVRLGTRGGDAAAFPRMAIAQSIQERLEQLLSHDDDEVEIVPTRFEPVDLPFLLVPDREAELKARLESDDADRRIASAALQLARMHVATKAESPLARLFVNLDCPVLTCALEAEGSQRDAAALLLRGLVGVLSRGDGGVELSEALRSVGTGFVQLMRGKVD